MARRNKSGCFINGVEYKCRTCFNPGRTVYPLTDEATETNSWGDLIKIIAPVQINNDEDLLPSTLCCKCTDKLKRSHEFILQIHNANKKYFKLLESRNDPLQEGLLNEIDQFTDYMTIDLPLKPIVTDVKLDKSEFIEDDSFLNANNQLEEKEDIKDICETEDADDPFTHAYNDNDFKISDLSEQEEEEVEEEESKLKKNRTKSNNRKRRKRSKKPTKSEVDEKNFKETKAKSTEKTEETKDSDEEEEKTMTLWEKFLKIKPELNSLDWDSTNQCPICSKVFANKSYIVEHVNTVHERIKPFKCSHCTKTFPSNHAKRLHELSHTDNFPFECKWCNRRFRQSSKLKIHSEIHTTKPELLCQICKRSQKSQEDMEEHLKKHEEKLLQCPACGKLVRRNSQLKDHYNAVHLKLRPYKCSYCELGFGDRKTRRVHERKHHKELIPNAST